MDTVDLDALEKDIRGAGLVKDRRYRLKVYKTVFVGSELVEWMVKQGKCQSSEDAVKIGALFLTSGKIHHVVDEHMFKNEFLFYRFMCDEEEGVREGRLHSWNIQNVVRKGTLALPMDQRTQKFFVLQTRSLIQYAMECAPVPEKSINIPPSGASVVVENSVLHIVHPFEEKDIFLEAESKPEAAEWARCLQLCGLRVSGV